MERNHTGIFTLPNGLTAYGNLRICGKNSALYLYSDTDRFSLTRDHLLITGNLFDGQQVTLIDCIMIERSSLCGPTKLYTARVFPHHVLIGDIKIQIDTPCIESINFSLQNMDAIFYEFDAFGTVRNTEPFKELLVEDMADMRKIEIGDCPIISYFCGERKILCVETKIGKIDVRHWPTNTIGCPVGVKISNRIVTTIDFDEPQTFESALQKYQVVRRFYELIIGREQPLTFFNAEINRKLNSVNIVDIYQSFDFDFRVWEEESKGSTIGPRDVLLCSWADSEQLARVMKNYIASDEDRRHSRVRFHDSLDFDQNYTVDRTIRAANLFDIFPDSAYPERQELRKDLEAAKEKARILFKDLPKDLERDQFLSAIGRIGSLSLKHKTRYRLSAAGLGKLFPDLQKVLEEAVGCRNYFVHGSKTKVDFIKNFNIVCFFTASLEFVFAVSDLVDQGWDVEKWKSNSPGADHPFGAFCINYDSEVRKFKKLLLRLSANNLVR
ncbi:MAG: hypothetical protein CVV64_20455 [Candidatus Wallbacteria bacterium HGW-Wallbacteria-1]|uniref:Uncharacterized protein n=1 Tax=Candidatus Wallbacteria bacterium HGW-Wallbacteria-1 TaxID=2013854 RepID=A0A2N1PI93_9BACT|nr:MAG: hypothetical protein CVV64_20455 [Candidatus Wallbacteria bacterium HGW-Wallbacteria-1]